MFSIIPLGDSFWIVNEESDSIYRLDQKGRVSEYGGTGVDRWHNGARCYSGIVTYCDRIITIPAFAKRIVCWKDKAAYEIGGDTWTLTNTNLSAFLTAIDLGEELWFLPFSADAIYSYSASSDVVKRISFSIDNDETKEFILNKMIFERDRNQVLYENSEFTLRDFVTGLKRDVMEI